MNIQEAIDKFIEYRAIRSRRSACTYRIALNHLIAWLDDRIIVAEDLTTQHIRDFAIWLANDYRSKHGQKLAMVSLELYLVSVLQFYADLIVDGHSSDNFLATRNWIKRMTRNRPRTPIENKLPPPEDVKALLEAVEVPLTLDDDVSQKIQQRRLLVWSRNRALVYCLESSGARVGEIVSLRHGDLIHNDKGAWCTGKGQKVRFIRFSPKAWEYLKEYLVSRPDALHRETPLFCRHDRAVGDKIEALSTLTVERLVNQLASAAGILNTFHLTPHSLRHYFATRFLRHTKNLALTQDVLGHQSPTTTRIYAKTSKADLIEAHAKIFD